MIAIKDMKMPKSCNECPMYQSEDSDYCDITGEWITGEEMIRHKNCPLVKIVTCKDCKYYRNKENKHFYCTKKLNVDSITDRYREPDYYCADAERR